ncbi:MAG TPA: hypothetical protein VEV84_13850 [Pyrinomonadaceae bacterium]|nr:hypothetical protein [Pyrinomonadaceae bacterium]
MSNGDHVKVQYQNLVVIWLALLASQVLFFVLVWFIKPELVSSDTSKPFFGDQPLIILAFGGSALVFFGLSLILSHQHIRRAAQDHDATCVQTGLTLGCALSEIPSILGLILALFFGYPYFYLWIALGAFGVLLHFPQKGNLDATSRI